ncbi:MAG TPA: DUF4292 domain-containing protein [Deltaproteobacteria bacterium]|nr:DUF4292 domain-containing protein [Deltaproteobacteria bacterium]
MHQRKLQTRGLFPVALLLLLSCCAGHVPPSAPPLDRQGVEGILRAIGEEQALVHTVISSGALTLHSKGSSSDATALIVASRDRSRIKIEITHTWGRPLLHILVRDQDLEILSFAEKRLYYGYVGTPGLSRVIPVPLSPELLWSLIRAYPVLVSYHRGVSPAGNRITLLNKDGIRVQVIDLYPVDGLPHRVSYCRQNTRVTFSNYKEEDKVRYAGKIQVDGPDEEVGLVLEISRMTFNRPIPEAIFTMKIPPDFTTEPLDRVQTGY